jgi:hypothetical protein
MFGCFVNLWEVEGNFFKKSRVYGLVVSKFEFFFWKMTDCKSFFQNFRDPYVKIHRQRGFRVDCYEIRGSYVKS